MKKVVISIIFLVATVFLVNNLGNIIKNNSTLKVNYTVPNIENVEFFAECDGYISKSDASGIKVTAYINERDIPDVKLNSYVLISGPALGDKEYEGFISYINDVATTINNGSFNKTVLECEITVKSDDSNLKKGYNVTAKIMTLKVDNALVINYDTVLNDEKNYWVYVVKDGKAVKQYIDVFKESENGYIINNGINNDDMLILDPSKIVSDSQRVNATLKGE